MKAVYIILGQSNAVGHGIPMREEDKILTPMKNVFGLDRTDNQSFDNERLIWKGYQSGGMNLGEEQDHTYSIPNCLATLWQKEIDNGVSLPDLYIVQIAIGAQGITDGYMWNPNKAPCLHPGKLGEVDISLYLFTKRILSLLDESFDDDYEIVGLHWRGGEEDTQAPFPLVKDTLYKLYASMISEFRKAVNKPLPITFHKIVCPDRMKAFDPNGENQCLEKMDFINQTFEKLSLDFENVSVFSPTLYPHYKEDTKGNGLFIEDFVHFTPEVNRWVAETTLKNYQKRNG